MLGEKVDAEVQTIIRAMRDSGAVVNTPIVIELWELFASEIGHY